MAVFVTRMVQPVSVSTTPRNIQCSLTFSLSKMQWEAAWIAIENGEVVTKSSGSNPSQLSNISVLEGTPITVLMVHNGTNTGLNGFQYTYTMANTYSRLYVVYPIENGTIQIYMS